MLNDKGPTVKLYLDFLLCQGLVPQTPALFKGQLYSVMDWIVYPPNLYAEALHLNVTVFGDRAFKEVIKITWGHKGGTLVP